MTIESYPLKDTGYLFWRVTGINPLWDLAGVVEQQAEQYYNLTCILQYQQCVA